MSPDLFFITLIQHKLMPNRLGRNKGKWLFFSVSFINSCEYISDVLCQTLQTFYRLNPCHLVSLCLHTPGWRNRRAACNRQEGGDKLRGGQSEAPKGSKGGLSVTICRYLAKILHTSYCVNTRMYVGERDTYMCVYFHEVTPMIDLLVKVEKHKFNN